MLRLWRLLAPFVVVAALGVTGCSETDTGSEGSGSDSAQDSESGGSGTKKTKKQEGCGSRATDDCTPRVASDKQVRVDALYWKVTKARTAAELGDQQYGLGAKADGRFVIVDLRVRSAKSESVTLTDEVVQLDAGGKTYKADSDGTIAAMGSGDDPLWFEDIGPDSVVRSKVVFDVPASALGKKLSLRFNELGFGSTHGFIRMPSLSASM
jgi:hypothetical protein